MPRQLLRTLLALSLLQEPPRMDAFKPVRDEHNDSQRRRRREVVGTGSTLSYLSPGALSASAHAFGVEPSSRASSYVRTLSSLCATNMTRRSGGAAETATQVLHLGSYLCSWLLVRLWRCRRGGKTPLVVGYATRGSTGLWCCVLCAGNCSLQRSSGLLGVVWYLLMWKG
jgi:hypothetical protein